MQSHAMPRELERAGKGEHRVKGTGLTIVQDGKQWKVQGHADDLGGFASRGAALAKLQELGAVPEVPAEQPKGERPAEEPKGEAQAEERKDQPKRRPRARKSEKVGASA